MKKAADARATQAPKTPHEVSVEGWITRHQRGH